MKFLIVGRGAMGILHAWFLERAGHDVSILARPGSSLNKSCGVVLSETITKQNRGTKTSSTSEEKKQDVEIPLIKPLKAQCVDIRGALSFLELAGNHHLSTSIGRSMSCILVAVKAHQIKEALRPLLQIPREVADPLPPVIMLHNGLIDLPTQSFIDTHIMSRHNCYHMITGGCATLLSKDEITQFLKKQFGRDTLQTGSKNNDQVRDYVAVTRPTGPGLAFIFPHKSSLGVKRESAQIFGGDGLTVQDQAVLRAMVCFASSNDAKDRQEYVNEQTYPAIPHSHFLPSDHGHAEQIVKLSVNVSLNGLLARRALSNWYRSVHNHYNRDVGVLKLAEKGLAALSLIRRVVNHEVRTELPLACELARLVMSRALRADPNNTTLKEYVMNDTASLRTLKTLDRVPNHVCSTVMDICNGRVTERAAMFSTVVNEWNNELQEKEAKNAAADVLCEIYEMLSLWDEYVRALRDVSVNVPLV